ncbi:MAG: sodium/proline symporter [Planctomycetes bacterium]|nr:sodium/proline symporter [Planctomycetota bacterium]
MDGATSLIATLIFYKIMLLSIGFWAARRSHDGADFYLGGRGLGPWVASISSAASSSSAWTLLGVSGAAYAHGLSAIWLLPACMSGFALNWFVIARPIRRLSHETGAVTLTELLAHGAAPKMARLITISASIVVLLSLGVYVASQFQAAGKTFAETLDMDFSIAVWVGGGIVLIYTMSGGFWAASVSDLIQGIVMAVAAAVVPIGALIEVGGLGNMYDGLAAVDPALVDFWRGKSGWMLIAFLAGTMGIGLGYPGQPHVVNRYMALRSEDDIRRGTWITMAWGLVIYCGMLLAGWCGRVLTSALADGETVLLRLTTDLFPPVVAGVIVAAVLSAIMSTADSQLLVCGSTVAHDLPRRSSIRKVGLDRFAIVAISLLAIVAALKVDESIFKTVLFAWSALGAAFGPLLLVRLLRGQVHDKAALASIWLGFGVTLIWYFTPLLKGALYELVPAFFIALIPAWLGVKRA